ncbi:MAG: M20/M25/M40 family metallo-hydrolase [Lachnospiraceae bacterium]|nr:M20/M25/M40 family metallo-hydrolase [Lachnospiraceae bacterium]
MKNNLKEWLEERENGLIRDIAALVEIESVAEDKPVARENGKRTAAPAPYGDGCRRALEQMIVLAEQKGLKTEDHEGHCVSISSGNGGTEIGIWNHLDVVPAGEGWLYPPFACTQKNGYLIGRGVQDNKGPAIAVLYAIWYCNEKNLLKHIRVRQILGCQEECGMQDIAWYLQNRRPPEYSFVADCGFPVCCGEKGGCRITFETEKETGQLWQIQGGTVCNSVPSSASAKLLSGGKWITLEAEGVGGHAAFPEGTVNAVHVLCRKIWEHMFPDEAGTAAQEKEEPESVEPVADGQLKWSEPEMKAAESSGYTERDRLYRTLRFLEEVSADGYGEKAGIACEDEISGKLTCNAGVVSMQEDRIRLELDIRYPVTKKTEDFLPGLQKKAEEAGFCMQEFRDSPPYYIDRKHPFVQVLMDAWSEVTGQSGEPFVMGGGTYARHIPNTVAFGPGTERDFSIPGLPAGHGNCHCADEAESIENLKQAVYIYINALMKIDKWIGGKNHEENKNKQ